jgi:hypothetical protein
MWYLALAYAATGTRAARDKFKGLHRLLLVAEPLFLTLISIFSGLLPELLHYSSLGTIMTQSKRIIVVVSIEYII